MGQAKKNIRRISTTSALAEHLGLSRWTVSRVLNNHPGVLPATVERVHQAIVELGFQPNALARGLRGARTGIIGLCFQEIESPILARKATVLQQGLRDEGFNALIELTNENEALEQRAIRHFLSMQVDGVILLGSALRPGDALLDVLEQERIPCVFVDPLYAPAGKAIRLDREHSMSMVIEYLYGMGHRDFALLGIDPQDSYGASRLSGLKRTVAKLDLSMERDFYLCYEEGDKIHNYAYGEFLVERLLRETRLPTAIVALNDRIAIGAISALRKAGLDVPGNVSVVGYDNLDVGGYFNPRLTTVEHRVPVMMHKAVETLLELIRAKKVPNSKREKGILIEPELVIRDSAGPPRAR